MIKELVEAFLSLPVDEQRRKLDYMKRAARVYRYRMDTQKDTQKKEEGCKIPANPLKMERETGFEPATLSLGSYSSDS